MTLFSCASYASEAAVRAANERGIREAIERQRQLEEQRKRDAERMRAIREAEKKQDARGKK